MGAGTDRENSLEAARLNEDEAFVRAGAKPAPVTRAEVIVNPGHPVVQGTMIQAVLETAMASMATTSVLAVEYGLNARLISVLIGVGVPLSLLTSVFWHRILELLF